MDGFDPMNEIKIIILIIIKIINLFLNKNLLEKNLILLIIGKIKRTIIDFIVISNPINFLLIDRKIE